MDTTSNPHSCPTCCQPITEEQAWRLANRDRIKDGYLSVTLDEWRRGSEMDPKGEPARSLLDASHRRWRDHSTKVRQVGEGGGGG